MTLTIDIAPEKEPLLHQRANVIGLPLEEYVSRMVDEQLVDHGLTPEYLANREAFEAIAFRDDWMDILNSVGVEAPVMSQEATRRESLYEDDL